MNVRNRAWRRRKTRGIVAKVKASRDWLMRQFEGKPNKDHIPHRPGKLTHAQALRQQWATNQELRDGFAEA